eukprot:251273_1
MLLLLIIYLYLANQIDLSKRAAIRFASYNARPLCSFDRLASKPGTFRNIFRIELDVFLHHIAIPLLDSICIPRNTLNYNIDVYIGRLRSSQIEDIDRIVRCYMRLRCVPEHLIAFYYDQDRSSVNRDFHHICRLVCARLGHHIAPIIPYSAEFYEKKGSRAFRHFPNALYACDVVKFERRRPSRLEDCVYYDGHKRSYTFGYFIGVDCDGLLRLRYGHCTGSDNDIQLYYWSDLYRNPYMYLAHGAVRCLTDGIFARIHGPFIVPFAYMNRPLTAAEIRYNHIHCWDRSIVEHYFSRVKGKFPLTMRYTLKEPSINYVMDTTFIFTNIMIKFQDPLRRY